MDSEQPDATDRTREPKLLVAVAIILIANFLWRVLIPAHVYPMRIEQILTMGFDLAVIVALVALRRRVTTLTPLFWVALVAGIGLFAIRLNGEASWWTGHLSYSLN